jgi:hypothetical protein
VPTAGGMGMGLGTATSAMPAAVMDSSLTSGSNGANSFTASNTGSLTATDGAFGASSSSSGSMGSLGGMGTGMVGGVGAMGTTVPGLSPSGSNPGELSAYGPGMPIARWGNGAVQSTEGVVQSPGVATATSGAGEWWLRWNGC